MSQSPLFTVAFWLIMLPALWASGSLAGFRLRGTNPLFSGILTLALGLGIYAYFLILAGSLGWLKPEAVLCFLAFSLALGWRTRMGVFRWLGDVYRFFWGPRDVLSRICQFSLIGTFFFTALFCFLPEIANDALAIHLYIAKLFVRNASVSPSYYDIASYRPLLMSVLYSTGLLFQNVAIAKFFHWFCGVLLVTALAIKVEEASESKKLALFFGLMLWLTPTLMNQITTTYIDAGVSLFVFLGYCVLIDGFDDLKRSSFFYGGMLIGLAVAVRTLSLGAVFAITVMLGLRLFGRSTKKKVMIAGGCFSLGVLMASAYWFLRDWIYTGNPVYPYLGSLFGTEDLSQFSTIYFRMGLPRSLGSFLMIPWDITFKPIYFDYHHWVGPFYLSVLPFVGYAALKIKKARPYLLFTFLFTLFWYFTGQNVRYLLPTLPVYLISAAMGVNDFRVHLRQSRWGSRLAKIVSCLAITSLLSLTAYHFRYQFMPVLGLWSGGKYLEKVERTAAITQWVNRNLPPQAKILILEEVHLFDFDRDVVLDADFNTRTHYKGASSHAAMVAILKEKGVTHILDAIDIQGHVLPAVSKQAERPIELLLKDRRFAQPLASLPSSNVLDRRCQYVLYKLV